MENHRTRTSRSFNQAFPDFLWSISIKKNIEGLFCTKKTTKCKQKVKLKCKDTQRKSSLQNLPKKKNKHLKKKKKHQQKTYKLIIEKKLYQQNPPTSRSLPWREPLKLRTWLFPPTMEPWAVFVFLFCFFCFYGFCMVFVCFWVCF